MKIYPQIIVAGLILIIIISLPFIIALKLAGETAHFGGFLLNPLDGNSYLAKMQEGYSGDWLFTLPYTPGDQKGAFLFEFYLFLGHLAKWTGLSILTMFHLTRILSTTIFLGMLFIFLKNFLNLTQDKLLLTFVLAIYGSGMGWLFTAFGLMTSDLWVAEAFPFLSAYTNPHFILGLALLLVLLIKIEGITIFDFLLIWVTGILLGIVYPFGVITAAIIFVMFSIWCAIEDRQWRWQWRPLTALLAGGGLAILFQYWQTINEPLLFLWNTQNVTPTPPVWDLFISFSPAFIFAVIVIVMNIKKKRFAEKDKIVLIWLGCALLLAFFPISLQRRFLFGIFIPISILAIEGLFILCKDKLKHIVLLFTFFLTFSVLTNVLLLFSALASVKNENSLLVLYPDEIDAFQWIRTNASKKDIILASPSLGNFIPAYTDQRVLYGHPFETVDAERQEVLITDFYSNAMSLQGQRDYLSSQDVNWLILGPREMKIGQPDILEQLDAVFKNNSVTIYDVVENP